VNALQQVRKKHPKANLWIVGDTPSQEVLEIDGVFYKGFFNKSDKIQYKALLAIFSEAFCLVHPTIKDTTTLVITESAYFGCPAISSNRFAIPEFIKEKETGLLLDNPRDTDEVAAKMSWLIENPDAYKIMRQTVRFFAIENNIWGKVGDRFKELIKT